MSAKNSPDDCEKCALEAEGMRARLLAVIDATSDLVSIADPDGKLAFLNSAGRKMLGLSAEQDLTTRRLQEFHPAWAVRVIKEEAFPAAFRDGTWSGETAMLTSSGTEFPVSQVITAHRDREGNVQYVSTIIRDIAGMKERNAQVVQSKKMAAAATLAAGVAHEFNNLQTAILLAAGFIKEEAKDNEEIQRCVADILAASERATGLTQRLLTFARRDRLSRSTRVSLNRLVQKKNANLQAVLGRNVNLVCELDPQLAETSVDSSDFDQILFSLAENARDAMPSGGKVVIRTSNANFKTAVPKEGIVAGDFVRFSFSDTGRGMDAATKARIFEPFFTTKGRASGVGLSLAALYGIVKRHGGVVQVQSEVGHGTSFDILFPAVCPLAGRPASSGSGDGQASANRDPSAPVILLLVDDEASLRRLMRVQLEKNGFVVYDAGSPEDALKIAREKAGSIDLLVSDVLMPQMDGRDLAQQVVAINSGIKVLLMSGYAPGDVPGGPPVTEHAFLAKPCSGAALVQKVREVLARSSDVRS